MLYVLYSYLRRPDRAFLSFVQEYGSLNLRVVGYTEFAKTPASSFHSPEV